MSTDQKRSLLKKLTIAAVLGLAPITGVAACASSDEPPAPEQIEARRTHGPAGALIEETLDWGELSVDQEAAVLAIRDELTLDDESRAAMRKELRASAAAVVRAGYADSPEFKQAVERALVVMKQRMQASSDAIVEIHELLEPDQRLLVADALRVRIEDHRDREHLRKSDMRFKNVAKQLMLSSLQIDKLKALRSEAKEEHRHGRPSYEEILALVDAFEGEDFATTLDAFNEAKEETMREHVERGGKHVGTALSFLEGHQRILLADMIEKHEPKPEH